MFEEPKNCDTKTKIIKRKLEVFSYLRSHISLSFEFLSSSISLFKDTTLVLIIGLMDFLAVVTGAAADKEWLGRHLEGYVFVAMVLWVML